MPLTTKFFTPSKRILTAAAHFILRAFIRMQILKTIFGQMKNTYYSSFLDKSSYYWSNSTFGYVLNPVLVFVSQSVFATYRNKCKMQTNIGKHNSLFVGLLNSSEIRL
jgi:hypothetical protein